MFDFLNKNAAIVVIGSRWCNQALPKTDLVVGKNKAGEYLSLSNQVKNILSANLKTLSDKALDPIIENLKIINELQTTLNLQIMNPFKALSTYVNLTSFIVSKTFFEIKGNNQVFSGAIS